MILLVDYVNNESLGDFVEDWLLDNIDWSKTIDDYGFYGRQDDYAFL